MRTRRTFLAIAACCWLLAAPQVQAFKCMPVYGHWCGPGHPAAGFPPPVDAFDAACQRHDLCTAGPEPNGLCDRRFVAELYALAEQFGYLPRPLQWAAYLLRVKSGGGWGAPPTPTPWDAFGLMSSLAAPCW